MAQGLINWQQSPQRLSSSTQHTVRADTEGLSAEGIMAVLISDHSGPLLTRGPYDPYVGSKTKEKRSEHGYKIVGTDTTSASFKKL